MWTVALFTLLTSAGPPPEVGIEEVDVVGVDAREAARLPARIADELELLGAQVVESGPAVPDARLRVSVVRVGPLIEVAVRLTTPAGAVLVEEHRQLEPGTLGGGTLLGPEAAAAIRGLERARREPEVTIVRTPPLAPRAEAAPVRTASRTEEEAEPEAAGGSSWVRWSVLGAGGATAVIGAGAAAVGLAAAALEASVRSDPASAGAAKARAAYTGPLALGASAVGGLVVVGGVAVAASSLLVE